jgi:hypothetical protein
VDRQLGAYSRKSTGLVLRLIDKDNFWVVTVDGPANIVQVHKVEGGNIAGLDGGGTNSFAFSAAYTTVRASFTGTTLTVYGDDNLLATITGQTTHAAGTKCGLGMIHDGGSINMSRWKNFRVDAP